MNMHQIEISNPRLKVDGVELELCPEIDEVDTCEGCFFNILDRDGYMQCIIPSSIGSATALCADQHKIWLPIETKSNVEKFTVAEVVEVLVDDLDLIPSVYVTQGLFEQMTQLIKQKQDPDYREYLRLKAKFE